MNIKDMVGGGKTVTFTRARKENLYYETECGFEFPVPIDDMGDATFNATDKAVFFMRYIRKHLKTVEEKL